MTAQVGDRLDNDGRLFSVLSRLPIPLSFSEHGLRPQMASTACYRGYFCHYAITEGQVHLEDLYVYTGEGEEGYPAVCGRLPERDRRKGGLMRYMGCAVYRGLHLPSLFTGTVTLGDGFLSEFYIHAGIQRPHSFTYLYDYRLERGRIVEITDRSAEGEAERKRLRDEREERLRAWEAAHKRRKGT